VILAAILAYKASEDSNRTSNERIVMPINKRTGEPMPWPSIRNPTRLGGLD
jgi:carboxypeptidase Q